MVLYDYECECGKVHEIVASYDDRVIHSPCCEGKLAKRILTPMRRCQIDIFQPSCYEEIGDDAPYITSKQQLADECAKRGLVSRHLEESYRRVKPNREYNHE